MKKGKAEDDDLAPEYDFGAMKRGVRGKYATRATDPVVVRLDDEVAAAFPTDKAVNDALRAVLKGREPKRRALPRARSGRR